MFDRAQLEAFFAVVQHGSFERAAQVLHVTRGAVSQRVKALEETLSTLLVTRNKPVVATQKGEILLRHVRSLRAMEDDTLCALLPAQRDRTPVPMAIAVNADSLATWFAPLAAQLLGRLNIALEIIADDQDHTFARLTKGDVVGCVSSSPGAVQGFESVPLGAMHYVCVATPAFKQTHFPKGVSLAAVLNAPALLFDRKDALHDQYLAQLFGVKGVQYPRHHFPSASILLNGISAGLGYAMAAESNVSPLLASGQLEELVPGCKVTVPLYWHHWKMELPLAQAMTQIITAHAHQALSPLG